MSPNDFQSSDDHKFLPFPLRRNCNFGRRSICTPDDISRRQPPSARPVIDSVTVSMMHTRLTSTPQHHSHSYQTILLGRGIVIYRNGPHANY
ncbi:hypothetical protein CDAR_235121 [Caerostris darwini]|uniref:Uncharacterized protein n=1 Tax=Caerostris darwini TaxID=1538125 RepID=A0AAV4MRE9_9ARAC|nr:hypothetical protein CDAR_235121 [Caerostris darwini]